MGQQALLSLLLEFLDFVKYCKYELSDSDAAVIVPYLYEKASFSKVRLYHNVRSVCVYLFNTLFFGLKREDFESSFWK